MFDSITGIGILKGMRKKMTDNMSESRGRFEKLEETMEEGKMSVEELEVK